MRFWLDLQELVVSRLGYVTTLQLRRAAPHAHSRPDGWALTIRMPQLGVFDLHTLQFEKDELMFRRLCKDDYPCLLVAGPASSSFAWERWWAYLRRPDIPGMLLTKI